MNLRDHPARVGALGKRYQMDMGCPRCGCEIDLDEGEIDGVVRVSLHCGRCGDAWLTTGETLIQGDCAPPDGDDDVETVWVRDYTLHR